VEVQSFAPLVKAGVKDDWLFDEARDALKFVREYVEKYDKFPTALVVDEQIGCELPDEPEDVDYLSEEVRKRRVTGALEKEMQRVIECIELRKPDEALKIMAEASSDLTADAVRGRVSSFKKDGSKRYDSYVEAKKVGGIIGLPTMWDTLNKSIQGWVDGGFHVVAAMQNTGKTWFLCICANHAAHVLGKLVLFVTLEMTSGKIGRRLDALRYEIPFGELRDCRLDELTEEEWRTCTEAAAVDESAGDILIADKTLVRTVPDVVALVREYKPDLVVVDGGYRFETARSQGSWERTLETVNALQAAAEKSDVPWVVSTQLGDSSESGKDMKSSKTVRAWNVRYGKEWTINPDVLIGLFQDEDLRLIGQMEVHTLKVREADELFGVFNMNWDLKGMKFEEIEGVMPSGTLAKPSEEGVVF